MQLKPFGSRILIRKHAEEKIGRIIVPTEAQKVSTRGVVIEVGPNCTEVEVGDDIFFGQYATVQLPTKNSEDLRSLHITDDEDKLGSDFFIMNEADIICQIIKGDNDAK